MAFDKKLLTPPENLQNTAGAFDECAYGCGTEVFCPMGHIRCSQCLFWWSDDEHKNAYRQWFKEQESKEIKNV